MRDLHPLAVRAGRIEEEHLDLITIIPRLGTAASTNMPPRTAALIVISSKINYTKAVASAIAFRSKLQAEGDAGRI
jgi:hypothetical protein